MNGTCYQNKTCTEGCELNHWGPDCNQECSDSCAQGQDNSTAVCDMNGICLFGCKKTFMGPNCLESCPVSCPERDCNAVSGHCLQDIQDRPSETPADVPAPSNVYFNAKLTHVTLDAQRIVVFDQVLVNVGGGYSSSTGIFRAPMSGTYLFSLTILSKTKAKYAHIQLMKNDVELGRIFAGSEIATWVQTGAVTIATHLTEGDEVYTREFPDHTGHLHGNNYCSFSGVLLNAD